MASVLPVLSPTASARLDSKPAANTENTLNGIHNASVAGTDKSGAKEPLIEPINGPSSRGATAGIKSSWWLPWRREPVDDRTGKNRVVYLNLSQPPGPVVKYPRNGIRTTKYTILTFLPKNLFEQFRRVANAYFVLMFILQTIPSIQAWPVTVAFVPLAIVLGITAVKDAFEDINRYRSDRQQNGQTCRILRDDGWSTATWADVHVGDIVRLAKNEVVPADMVIIASAEEEGLCYIETKNLDGETNLKVKRGTKALEAYRTHQELASLRMEVRLDSPLQDLYKFAGSVALFDETGNADDLNMRAFPLTIDNLLPRGCVIRNSQYVLGLAAYTGVDTKVMLNAGRTPSKRTKVEKLMNTQIFFIFFIQVIFCIGFTIGTYYFSIGNQVHLATFYEGDFTSVNNSLDAFLNFWTLLVISQNLIPIALYASVEFVKLFQAFFINQDEEMYNTKMSQPCTPRTWNLSDDLGQIEYVFTDKTGTLTSNVMSFNQCSIHGHAFGRDLPTMDAPREALTNAMTPPRFTEKQMPSRLSISSLPRTSHDDDWHDEPTGDGHLKRHLSGTDISSNWAAMLKTLRQYLGADTFKFSEDHFEFLDSNMMRALIATAASLGRPILHENKMIPKYTFDDPQFPHYMTMFFLVLALCHSTVAEYPGQSDADDDAEQVASEASPTSNKVVYNAQSPDEAALVRAASNLGIVFLGKSRGKMSCLVFGERREYQQLHELAFTSDRKRMSVIVQAPDNSILLLCKGADNVIYERLASTNSPSVYTETQQHLSRFSSEGLRTLCIAYRVLDAGQYAQWDTEYAAASLSDPSQRQEAMDRLADSIERELTLLGATAIEDRLQKHVPETIADLMDAGLLVWMLTGDKLETAVNIALTCNLIDEADTHIRLPTGSDVHAILEEWAIKLCTDMIYEKSTGQLVPITHAKNMIDAHVSPERPVLIIEGGALVAALKPETEQLFAETALRCRSVVCCRVSPKQKAKVVEVIKKYRSGLTLAIGDGANDVTMLQAAHVGVGIAGLEGRQAVMASDYAFARFRYLRRLLLVHGRWSYFRAAEMALYFFFKNFVFVFPLFWFQILCGYSSQMIYHFSYQTFYNLVFTSLPIVATGTFDQDYPGAYTVGMSGSRFTRTLFWMIIVEGLYQGTVCLMFPLWILAFNFSSSTFSGYELGIYDLGFVVMSCVIFAATMSLALQVRNWTWIIYVSMIISLLAFYLYHVIAGFLHSNSFFTYELYGVPSRVMSQPAYWLCLVVTVTLALLPRLVYRYVVWTTSPGDAEILREREVLRYEKPMLTTESQLGRYD